MNFDEFADHLAALPEKLKKEAIENIISKRKDQIKSCIDKYKSDINSDTDKVTFDVFLNPDENIQTRLVFSDGFPETVKEKITSDLKTY